MLSLKPELLKRMNVQRLLLYKTSFYMVLKIVDVSDVIGNEINLQKSYFFFDFPFAF